MKQGYGWKVLGKKLKWKQASFEYACCPTKVMQQLTREQMLARIRKGTVSSTSAVVAETIIEDTVRQVLNSWTMPLGKPRQVFFSNNGVLTPAFATHLRYDLTVYTSRLRKTIGEFVVGVRAFACGYELATDESGEIIMMEIPNPKAGEIQPAQIEIDNPEWDSTDPESPMKILVANPRAGEVEPDVIEVPEAIEYDENGIKLLPLELFYFALQWGIDKNRPRFANVKGEDALNLVPQRGVPRKDNSQVQADGTTKASQGERVDWAKIPGFQNLLEGPIINFLNINDPNLNAIVSGIPIASDAPSLKKAEAKQNASDAAKPQTPGGVASNARQAVTPEELAAIPDDTFESGADVAGSTGEATEGTDQAE